MSDPSVLGLARAVAARVAALGGARGEALEKLAASWHEPGEVGALLGARGAQGARKLGELLLARGRTCAGVDSIGEALDGSPGEVVLAWLESIADADQAVLGAPILALAAAKRRRPQNLERAARARVRGGPIPDALACLPHSGAPDWLREDDAALARVELLVWEAGACARSVPALARWLLRDAATASLLLDGARSDLGRRSIAARALAVAADGVGASCEPAVSMRVVALLEKLASHPEPIVWIFAARALGRLAAQLAEARAVVDRWTRSEHPGRRRRAVTMLGSSPVSAGFSSDLLDGALEDADPWVAVALGPAVPILAVERREVWDWLSRRIETRRPDPEVLWSVTLGMLALVRRGDADSASTRLLYAARQRAERASTRDPEDARLWFSVRRETSFLEGEGPDPGDVESLLEQCVTSAVQGGARAQAGRAARIARSLGPVFEAAAKTASRSRDVADRAAAFETMEAASRAAAVRLWAPIFRAAGRDPAGLDAELEEARDSMQRSASRMLPGRTEDLALHRSLLRVLGHLVDGCGGSGEGARGPGASAAEALAVMESARWIAAGTGKHASRFPRTVANLLWRVIDAADASGARPVGPVAAWLAVASRLGPGLLELVVPTEPVLAGEGLARVVEPADLLRSELVHPEAWKGGWSAAAVSHLESLGARQTGLAYALLILGEGLRKANEVREKPSRQGLEDALGVLAEGCAHARAVVSSPSIALAAPSPTWLEDEDKRRVELSCKLPGGKLDYVAARWAENLGPVIGPLVEGALKRVLHACSRAKEQKKRAKKFAPGGEVGPYHLVKRLGGGAMGDVWLVNRPPHKHRFVMKIPKLDDLGDEKRERLIAALKREAEALDQLQSPFVAGFVDHGLDGEVPYLVLQYLAGADLDRYLGDEALEDPPRESTRKPIRLDECLAIADHVALGLRDLHANGLVHRDIKSGNVFLRLGLPQGIDAFDVVEHRDRVPVHSAVVIDFGLVGRAGVAGGELISGTPGYIAPEQAEGLPVDGQADVYSLAATIYEALTLRTFFDDLDRSDWDAYQEKVTTVHALSPERIAELREILKTDGVPAVLIDELVRDLVAASEVNPFARSDLETFHRGLREIQLQLSGNLII